MVPWNSASGGFAYIWQRKWVGIIAIKTERTQIYFLNDILVAVASFDFKVPNCLALTEFILGDPGADNGGEGKSKRAEKYGTRKVKNGEKSPWGECLITPVPNGRRRSAFWLGRKTQNFLAPIRSQNGGDRFKLSLCGRRKKGRGREEGEREKGREPSPQSPSPFSLPPYPLPPTPFDACYAGYLELVW